MKSEFKAKFIQHLAQKRKAEAGFTLIELLVVIIIIGILAAIALPSFLNQANKAKESESKQYTGSMNRTQQAYYLEKSTFTTDIALLGLGIKTASTNYTYAATDATNTGVKSVSYPINSTILRAHTGAVQVASTTGTTSGETTTLAVLCQSARPAAGNPAGANFTGTGASQGPTCVTPGFENLLN